VWRVRDLSQTEKFYAGFLGTPLERAADSIMYQLGDTWLFFTRCTGSDAATYDKEQVGLNHFALGVRTLKQLEKIRDQLDAAEIAHSASSSIPMEAKSLFG
jgi:catechol-2,3-dioxygenase